MIAYRFQKKDGEWQWLQTSSRLVYKNSKPDFVICTHRQLMEEEGRDLLGKRTMDFKVILSQLPTDSRWNQCESHRLAIWTLVSRQATLQKPISFSWLLMAPIQQLWTIPEPLSLQRKEPTDATKLNYETFSRLVDQSEKCRELPAYKLQIRQVDNSPVHRRWLTTFPTQQPWQSLTQISTRPCTLLLLFPMVQRPRKISTWPSRFTRADFIHRPKISFINTDICRAVITQTITIITRRLITLLMVSCRTEMVTV